jgi:hypothetical protein
MPNVPAGTLISATSATATKPVQECHMCRQITNYSPNQWMCVGNSQNNFRDGGNRASDLSWASDPASGSKKNAGYVNDPFGYDRLAPTDAAGQPLNPNASKTLGQAACMPPFSQFTVNLQNSNDSQLNNIQAMVSPFDTEQPQKDPGRFIELFANSWRKCARNIGTCPTNQNNDFQRTGGTNVPVDFFDGDDEPGDDIKYTCNSQRGTFYAQPADTPAPNNFTYGAFDTSGGTSDRHQGWQNRASILSLSPGLGADWQGSRYQEEPGKFGCNGGCHDREYGC